MGTIHDARRGEVLLQHAAGLLLMQTPTKQGTHTVICLECDQLTRRKYSICYLFNIRIASYTTEYKKIHKTERERKKETLKNYTSRQTIMKKAL